MVYELYLNKNIIKHIQGVDILPHYAAIRSNALEAYKVTHIGLENMASSSK